MPDRRPIHFRGAIDNYELERQFDDFFHWLEFERVTPLVGLNPDFENADYIHRERRIVVELKIIDKDYFKDGGFIHRLHAMVPAPVDVDETGLGKYTVKLHEGSGDGFEEPMHRLVRKANRQVRETIRRLLDGNGTGFLVVATNGFRTLGAGALAEMIGQLIKKDADSLNGYLVCYPRLAQKLPDGRKVSISHTGIGRDCTEEQEFMIASLGNAWAEFFSTGGHP